MQVFQRLLLLAALFPMALAGAAFAERPEGRAGGFGMHRDRGPERFIEEHAEELGLSAETREAMEEIAADSRARSEELREASSADRDAMHALMKEPLPDEDAVMKLSDKMSANHREMKKSRLEAMLEIRKLLTEEQRAKLVEIRESKPRGRGGPLGSCRQDIEDLCVEAEPGRATLQCIVERWDMLSDGCRSSFERTGRHRPRHGKGGPPDVD